jgi:diguanylate cyclase (GGDEF)-like protein/PAS domain S-box-containing protein
MGMPPSTEKNLIPGKLLVVDDDFNVRQLSRAVLDEAGYVVYDCADGISALNEFVLKKPDIVLLDVIMPGKSGFDVCAEIRSLPEGSDVPIVIMTGLDDTESILRAFREGATDFITKPINWETLPYRMQYIFKAGRAFKDLRISQKKLSHAQHIAKMGSWEWHLRPDEVLLSDPCRYMLGLQSDQPVLTISSFVELVHATDRDRVREALDRLVEGGLPLKMDCRWTVPNGSHRYFHLGAEDHRDPVDRAVYITGTIQDITERKQTEEKIRYLAYYDSLTGLPNRALFKEHLKRSLGMAQQQKHILAVLFIDLDRFKGVNDSLGHDAGDQLLQQVAERIQQYVRSYDTLSRCSTEFENSIVSRIGGDEFTILLDDIKSAGVTAVVARRVISTLEAPFILNGQEVFISASIGISIYPDDCTDVDSLVKYADIAMYSAKCSGRGTFQFYTQEMNEASMRQLQIETHLRKALEENALSICYQPQVDCVTNRIVGLEALVRWENSELGNIDPDAFIPVAEEAGLIIALDRWMLETVCLQLSVWQKEGVCPDRVSVNISARHFQKKSLPVTLEMILNVHENVRQSLEIEITERSLLDNTEEVIRSLEQIAASNIHISVDDFGTGYSSLSYLTRIPCNTIKIDKSFIAGINIDSSSMSIIIAIIALAKSLDKEVIAEGVETVEQLDFLKHHGCRIIQGYLYSKPQSVEQINELLRPTLANNQPCSVTGSASRQWIGLT